MRAWAEMVTRVRTLMLVWLGNVKGVLVPSGFSRISAICSRARTKENSSNSNALMTFILGAPTGKCVTKEPLRLQLQRLPRQEHPYRRYLDQRSQDEIG